MFQGVHLLIVQAVFASLVSSEHCVNAEVLSYVKCQDAALCRPENPSNIAGYCHAGGSRGHFARELNAAVQAKKCEKLSRHPMNSRDNAHVPA
jgi:hypothetical protein